MFIPGYSGITISMQYHQVSSVTMLLIMQEKEFLSSTRHSIICAISATSLLRNNRKSKCRQTFNRRRAKSQNLIVSEWHGSLTCWDHINRDIQEKNLWHGNVRRQAIIWSNAGILLIAPLGTNFSDILIEIHKFSLKKCIWKCRLGNGGHFVSASMC